MPLINTATSHDCSLLTSVRLAPRKPCAVSVSDAAAVFERAHPVLVFAPELEGLSHKAVGIGVTGNARDRKDHTSRRISILVPMPYAKGESKNHGLSL